MTRITIVAGACLIGLVTSADAIEKLDCFGTEPFWIATFTGQRATFDVNQSLRDYPAPTYKPAEGSSWRYAVSVTAHKGRSTLLAFIVNVTGLHWTAKRRRLQAATTLITPIARIRCRNVAILTSSICS